jgi:hypothetical protein
MVVIPVMEITAVLQLVLAARAKSLMARIIVHDAIVRKGVETWDIGWNRSEVIARCR